MHFPVSKRYIDYLMHPFRTDTVQALNNVSTVIQPGDRVAFMGANGAGKTTLLKLIGGLLYPSKGTITVNGFDVKKHNLKARKKVGFVLNEERSFYWRLTGIQNLQFYGALDNLYGAQLNQKIKELIELVGLGKDANRLFAGYSSGMRQKLAIARGLLSQPDILVLDEPTRTLDPISTEEIKSLISRKIHEGKERTLLIATHRLDEAEMLCNKVCFMKHGRILLIQTISEILDEYGSLIKCYQQVMNDKLTHADII